jgi:hypothetical protein
MAALNKNSHLTENNMRCCELGLGWLWALVSSVFRPGNRSAIVLGAQCRQRQTVVREMLGGQDILSPLGTGCGAEASL